ncbi:MAG: 2-oxo acid dehydrogenase subunit E2 [Clostridia bacterium]|nr:2-oxo acid dehydrogenase subunit E2 [Clostridia bacterium]
MRADGTRLKKTDPMYTVAAYVMDKRMDSMNMITIDIPIEPIHNYIIEKRKQGVTLSHMSVVLSAYIRTVAEYPMLNRFIVNRKPYARNELAVGMVVLKSGQTDNGTMSKMYFDVKNTVFDVNNIIDEYVVANRETPDDNGTEKMIKILLSIPGVLPIGVGICKFLDKHGLLPKKIIDASPFHNSLVISNLASIRTNHIYHHIYEFGTTSVIMTMGNSREVPKRKNGEIVFEKCMPLGVVMDERICSGSYYAIAFRRMKQYLANPELLEQPPKVINEDPDLNNK